MTLQIESVGRDRTGDALAPAFATMGFELPDEAVEEFARLPEYDLRLVGRDGGDVVAALGSFTFAMTTPGGAVETAGLTGVGVVTTHRRRGHLRELMRAYLDGVHEREQGVSALWASEAPIYGRFGYGMASLQAMLDLETVRAAFVPGASAAMRARLVDEDEALALARPIFERVRAETPGMLSRSDEWWRARRLSDSEWSRRGRGPLRRLIIDVEDEPVGYALYRQTHNWDGGIPGGIVHVTEAIAAAPEATRALWRYLCDIDLSEKVSGWMLPLDHPLVLLSAEPRRLGWRLADALWVRLVDVGEALVARGYADAEPVTLEVADDFCPWNEGRWRVAPDGCERTGDAADVAVAVAALGSAYLGGFSFEDLGRAGLASELREGGLRRADALFVRDRAPWCPEIF